MLIVNPNSPTANFMCNCVDLSESGEILNEGSTVVITRLIEVCQTWTISQKFQSIRYFGTTYLMSSVKYILYKLQYVSIR